MEAAAISLVGSLLPLAGAIANGYVASRNNRIMREWIEVAGRALVLAERAFDPDDPQLIAVFNRLTIGALQTRRRDKWDLLANALKNSGSGRSTPDTLQERFADLAVRWTPEHVRCLLLVRQSRQEMITYGWDPSDRQVTLGQFMPETLLRGVEDAGLVSAAIWRDLYDAGMLVSDFGPGMQVRALNEASLSSLGRRFITYLGA